jgi:hypothetical protein
MLYIPFRFGRNGRKISYWHANRYEAPPCSTSPKISACFGRFVYVIRPEYFLAFYFLFSSSCLQLQAVEDITAASSFKPLPVCPLFLPPPATLSNPIQSSSPSSPPLLLLLLLLLFLLSSSSSSSFFFPPSSLSVSVHFLYFFFFFFVFLVQVP